MTHSRHLAATVLVGALCAWLPSGVAHPCSIFAASDGDLVLASNNEDYHTAGNDTAMLLVPPDGGHYGYVIVGYSTFSDQATFSAQGGANDQGLFLDANAAPLLEAHTNPYGRRVTGMDLFAGLLGSCATVQEALDTLASFNLTGIIERAKIFIADRHGDAAIFEGDWVTHKTGTYLISTNFYESHPGLGGYPCWRYDAIEQLLLSGSPLSMDFMVQAAEAAHAGTSTDSAGITFFTNVHDLNTNLFRLYYLLDYEHPLVFDLDEELALGGGLYLMADLFGAPVATDSAEITFHAPAYPLPFRLPVIVRDAGANRDPGAREQIQVLVSAPGEPYGEVVVLNELREDLGVFAGAIQAKAGAPVAGDGILQVAANDTVTATYDDPDDGSGSAADVEAHTILVCDLDRDGADDEVCGGPDCQDLQADIGPHATEFCDLEDDDCDGEVDEACTPCDTARETDISVDLDLLDPNPLACGTCYQGDFDELPYTDEGHYRYWADVYRIEAEAGDSVVFGVFREAPNGILNMVLYDEAFEPLAGDSGLGWFQHTFEEDGAYLLALLLQRVDHATEPNAYRLELHRAGASDSDPDWPGDTPPRRPSSRLSPGEVERRLELPAPVMQLRTSGRVGP